MAPGRWHASPTSAAHLPRRWRPRSTSWARSSASRRATSPSSPARTCEAAVDFSNAFAPEHLELHCEEAAALVPAIRERRRRLRGPARRDRLRRLRHRQQSRAAHRRLGALCPGALRYRPSRSVWPWWSSAPQRRPPSRLRSRPSPRKRACAPTLGPRACAADEEPAAGSPGAGPPAGGRSRRLCWRRVCCRRGGWTR